MATTGTGGAPYGAGFMQTQYFGSPGQPSPLGYIAGSAAGIGFWIVNMIGVFFLPACLIVSLIGMTQLVWNTDNWVITWTWWRMWGPDLFCIFVPPLIIWIDYQLRKGVSVANRGAAYFNQSVTNIIYFVGTAVILVFAIFMGICLVWYGVQDIANCSNSNRCRGSHMLRTTPLPGAIMKLVGDSLAIVLMFIVLVIQAFLWYSTRQVTIMAVLGSPYAQIAGEIGHELQPHPVTPLRHTGAGLIKRTYAQLPNSPQL